ncbi:MAG: PAS domain S-box protein [Anaerolineales bacterium]|nr:PAS domain S-box protein [Anaerolineales bacterium]
MSPFQILLIDDNEHDRALTERELRRQFPDCRVTSVGTDSALTRALKGARFQLAITDYQLPWTDGVALFQRIRRQDPDCPVILYTGSGSSETAARALKAGVDDYVVKSTDHLPQLMMSVRLALERTKQQRATAKAEDRYKVLFQTLPIGILLVGPGGRLIDANPRMVEMLGYPDRESLLSVERVHLFENEKVTKEFHRQLRAQKNLNGFEARLRRKDGSLLWCRFVVNPVGGADGAPESFEAVVEDIHLQKETEAKRLENERETLQISGRLRTILEAAPTPILGVDEHGKIGFVWNQAAASLLGMPRDEAFGRGLFEILPELAAHAGRLFPAKAIPAEIRGLEFTCTPPGREKLDLNISISANVMNMEGGSGRILVLTDLTTRKAAEDALRLNESRLGLVFDSVSDMLMLLGVESETVFRVVKVNRAVTQITGRPAESLIGRTLQDFLTEPILRFNTEKFQIALRSGKRTDFTLSTRPPGRPRLSMDVTLIPIADSSQSCSHILVVARDITARLRSEREVRHALHALGESEHRYRALAEAAHDMIFILDRDLNVEYVNSFASLMFNRPVAEIVGRSMESLFPPAVAERQAEIVRRLFDGGEPAYRENPSWIGGRELWIGTWLVPMRDSGGRISSVLGVARDISERVQSEKALRESEEQYRSLVQTSPDAIFLHSLDTRFSFANQRALDILGYASPDDLRGTFLPELVHPDERHLAEIHLQNLLRTGTVRNAVLSFLRKDGSSVPMEVNASLILDSNGRMKGITSILRDITERRKRERALMEGEARFRAIFEKAAIGIFLIGLDGRLIEGNQAICDILETPHDELVGRALEQIMLADDTAANRSQFEDILNNRRDHYRQEARLLGKNNHWIWCRMTVSAVKDIHNQPSFMIGMAEDISKQLEAEQATRQSAEALRRYAERLETLHAIDRSILEARTPEEIAHATLKKIHQLLPSQRSSLVLFDMEARTAMILDTHQKNECRLEKGQVVPLSDYELELPFLRKGELFAIEDLLAMEDPPPTVESLRTEGIRSYLSFPLLSQDELIGALTIASGIPGAFTREHAEIASEVADLLAVAIRQARLFHQVRRHTFELESIAGLNRELRLAPNRAEIPAIIVRQTAQILKCEAVALLMADTSGDNYTIEQSAGVDFVPPGSVLPAKGSMTSEAIANGKTFVRNAPAGSGPGAGAEDMYGMQSLACAPLASRGAIIGALWAARRPGTSAGEITPDELRILESIGEVAGNALHRAALHDQTEQRLRRLSALRAVDMAISASIDLRVTLSVLLDQVTTQLGVDAAAIRLLNPHSQSLTYLSGRGIQSPAIMQASLPLGQGYAGTAALEHRVVSVALWKEEENAYARLLRESDDRFAAYFVTPLLAKGRIKGVLELFHRSALQADEEWMEYLETMATQAAIAIDNASMFEDVQKTNTELVAAYDATIEGWSRALELRDRETQGHTLRVTDIAIRLARIMGIQENELVHVRRGALLHDIGKMAISDLILRKPDALTAEETNIMRQHPVFAYEMLNPIAYLRPAIDIPYCHHEKWDGSGYPRGLEKDHIPLAARVFAVIDVWDALRSDRPYCAAWPEDKVRQYLRDQSGRHFDPAVVEAFLKIVDEELS